MGKYHIIITNNETGQVLADTDTDAIIGAFTEGEGTRSVCYTNCDMAELAAMLTGALQITNKHMADLPRWLQRMIKKTSKKDLD
jgi:hypothetical protein